MKRTKRDGVLNMLKIRKILRLAEEGLNQSEIALGSGASRAAVQDYLRCAEAQEITFRKAKEMSDEPGSRGRAAPWPSFQPWCKPR